jgi:hypothetical protein
MDPPRLSILSTYTSLLAAAGHGLSFIYLFIRFADAQLLAVLPLLGAATVSSGRF